MNYAELHCLSNFSFQRGASHAHELIQRAKDLGYAALAITDECSMAGIVRAHQAAQQAGLKLIVGTEVQFEDGPKLVLLAENHDGYSAICGLITKARRATEKGEYKLRRSELPLPLAPSRRGRGETLPGVSVLWCPPAEIREEEATWLREHFRDRVWIAVELHRSAADAARLRQLQELGARCGLPLVAAGDVHMHARERRALHDVLTAIRQGLPLTECGRRLLPNGERHLRTLEELRELYPAALLDETLRVAERCTFRLDELRYQYPHELVPDNETAASWLRKLTEQGLRRRWPQGASGEVRALIEKELALIAELNYEHFFLTVQDIVRYAREQNILCQGRGSAANSAVCYALGITEVDPARMNMLFERFISKERDEPPDIDVDFEHQRREEVIQYVYGKYGRERAAIAATVIRYQPRSAIRDVGKALGLPPDTVDRLSKSLAWWDESAQLPERLRAAGLHPQAPVAQQLVALVNELIGFPRHLSQHVGGFVISDRPLSELVPVENAAMPERTIIQWDKDDLEALGLLKVDVLALGMLSALRRALEFVSQRRGRPFGLQDIPAEDPDTYAMIGRGETVGVFQIESRAQMSMLPRLKPKEFYDLVIEVAIVRPGPIQGGMVHPYLRRRNQEEKEEYPSEELKKVLGRTLGVPLFQEQVMQIAVVAAGFTPGEADQLRRSMAAWKRSGGMDHLRERLMRGMAQRGYTPAFAACIFEMIRGFGSYGFPESHAASFALLAYDSAWLKCHEPAAFFAAILNSLPVGFYAPAQLVREAQRSGVEVRAVDVAVSEWDCRLELDGPTPPPNPLPQGEGERGRCQLASPSPCGRGQGRGCGAPALRLGLRLVNGLSEDAARRIMAARAHTPFTDIEDLVHRARLDARARKALADADALRSLAGHRHSARWAALGIEDLPGLLRGHSARESALALRAPSEGEDILHDYRSLGLTLRRHPVALLRARLDRLGVVRAAELPQLANGRNVRVAGLVINRQRPGTASGVIFMTLEDETGHHNLVIWNSVFAQQRAAVLDANFLIVNGELQVSDGAIHVIARRLHDRSHWIGELPVLSRDFH